jgi:hypothetical protein
MYWYESKFFTIVENDYTFQNPLLRTQAVRHDACNQWNRVLCCASSHNVRNSQTQNIVVECCISLTHTVTDFVFCHGATFPSRPRSPHYWGITITFSKREESSWQVFRPSQRPLPDNTQHSQETNTHAPAGFEQAIPAGERLQIHALDCAATGIGIYSLINNTIKLVY